MEREIHGIAWRKRRGERRKGSVMSKCKKLEIFQTIIGVAFTIITGFITFYTYQDLQLQRIQEKRQRVFELNQQWKSSDFAQYRLVAWEELHYDWIKGNTAAADWISGKYFNYEGKKAEKLFPQHKRIAIREVVGFFAELGLLAESDLIDKSLAVSLFSDYWGYWCPFLGEIYEKLHLIQNDLEKAGDSFTVTVPRIKRLKDTARLFSEAEECQNKFSSVIK